MQPQPRDKRLFGDPDGVYMAAQHEVGLALARLIPPGPVLEMCCGVGGTTRGLASLHQVVAMDRNPDRLAATAANLKALGLREKAALLLCDLRRPAIHPVPGFSFAACVADPDWSPAGCAPRDWTQDPQRMQPPVAGLLRLARNFAPKTALRLPPGEYPRLPGAPWPVMRRGREIYRYLLCGDWPRIPDPLHL